MGKQKTIRLKELKPAPYNPRIISEKDLEELGKSMDEFGDLSGIIFNRRTKRLIGGHQRIKHLDSDAEIVRQDHKDKTGTVAIGYVQTRTGRWIYREVDWPERKEKFANIAANKHGGEWDLPKLKDLIVDIDLGEMPIELTGFDYGELSDLISYAKGSKENLPDDEIPEKPKKPKTKLGDLITLGHHRLLCGDATNPDHVKRLFEDMTPLMLVTDPPYGVHYDPEWRIEHDKSENHRVGKVNNDDRVDWSAAYQLFPGDIAYVWHAGIYAGDIAANLRDSNLFIRAQIIWRKQHFVFSRGAYHWQHEPCWYAVRKGKKSQWCGDRTQSTLWEIENRNPFGGKTEDADTQHSTQKPVECMGRPIRNHGNKGDVVYDPFVGAGTTIVAAEHLERRCLAIEIDPGYCDVTIERWEKLTGQRAERTRV